MTWKRLLHCWSFVIESTGSVMVMSRNWGRCITFYVLFRHHFWWQDFWQMNVSYNEIFKWQILFRKPHLWWTLVVQWGSSSFPKLRVEHTMWFDVEGYILIQEISDVHSITTWLMRLTAHISQCHLFRHRRTLNKHCSGRPVGKQFLCNNMYDQLGSPRYHRQL